ncbi:hypothetical protein, partial [Bacteroides stercoris]
KGHYTYPMVAQFSTGILAHFSISIYILKAFTRQERRLTMAIVTVQDIYRCDSCKAASDELGRGCKHGMLFPLMLIMGNFTECMNYEFDAEKVKLQLKRKEAK